MTSPDITIRPATTADVDTLVELQGALSEETEHVPLDPSYARVGIGHLLRSPELGHYVVATDAAGTIVGCLLVLSEWSTWYNAEVWWIHDVYVRPAWRSRGVFRRLYDHVRARVAPEGPVRGLRLYVARANVIAQRTYERLGMRQDRWLLYEWFPSHGNARS
jgi:ribosomal protein S18 acetylase RimI-like enzyme